jgi:hypothetical protein
MSTVLRLGTPEVYSRTSSSLFITPNWEVGVIKKWYHMRILSGKNYFRKLQTGSREEAGRT